uniref:Kelch domain containing 2 n=1 Tax=Zonotrichia albicollis TaxID=44394 RepID=A0A8D2MLB7_ZONAL
WGKEKGALGSFLLPGSGCKTKVKLHAACLALLGADCPQQVLNGADCNAQVRGFYDFYLPRDEIWIYNMETGRWKKSRTEGDVPPSMSGSCAVCVDRVLYLFGGHHARGNTNKFYMLNARSTDRVLQWVRVECQGVPPSCKDKLGVWVHKNRLIFFGGYGYFPEGKQRGSFEFDETSFWNSGLPRGWNDHVHVLDLETFTWSQPITTLVTCSSEPLGCSSVQWGTQGSLPLLRAVPSARGSSSGSAALLVLPSGQAGMRVGSMGAALRCRLWHTACASEEGEVIIFGGCANNLLAHSKAAHSNEILVFSLQPRSLVRLCLEAVICFKELLASSWHCLPKHLLHSVNQRFGSNNTSGS